MVVTSLPTYSDVTPSPPPRHINFIEPFNFTAGDQLVVPIGVSHISLRLQEIQSREREKKEQMNNMLGLIQAQEGKLCNIVHVYTNTGPHLMPTGLSAPVSTGHSRHPSPTPSSFVQLSFFRPLTTPGHVEIACPKPFVWFRAKTDKGIVCLADHQHSVTY